MENVTQAVNDELTQSLDYKLATSNVNYVQSRRDVQYYPSSLSTFTPTTSRVARIPLTSGMDFIDPESVKIAFRIRNNNTDADGLFPGTIEPSCFIKRVQLYSNGQRTDDISEYGRSCYLYSLLKPQEWYNQRGLEGFWQDPGGHAVEIPAGEYREVLMAPTLIGLFQCGKMLPPQLNLVLELEFAEAADALRPAGGTTDFSIENVRVLASQVTLDSALQESFNKVLLSGRSLIFSYPTMHTQVSNVPAGVTSHNVTVARAYTKLMGAFVTFRQLSDSEGECKNLEYPGPGAHAFNRRGRCSWGPSSTPGTRSPARRNSTTSWRSWAASGTCASWTTSTPTTSSSPPSPRSASPSTPSPASARGRGTLRASRSRTCWRTAWSACTSTWYRIKLSLCRAPV